MTQELEFVSEPYTDFILHIEGDVRALMVAGALAVGVATLALWWIRHRRRRA